MREKYSTLTWFPLLCFSILSFVKPASAQEVVWRHQGLGNTPNISLLMEGSKASLILLSSPFSSRVIALDPKDGSVRWEEELAERVARPGRLVADIALIATHTGSLLALDSDDGTILWRQRTEKEADFAAMTPAFVEGFVYTLTEKGVLSRFSIAGERLTKVQVDPDVEGRRADIVPMWRDNKGLSILDQAGRLRTFDLVTLDVVLDRQLTTGVGPGLGPLRCEVLGGVYSAPRDRIWTSELSGLLRASLVSNNKTIWTAKVGQPENLYSEEGRVLAVPILSPAPDQKTLLVTRHRAWAFRADTGEVLQVRDLPSPAVAPPLFDSARQTWWVITQHSLVELRWDGLSRIVDLPILETPYTAALAGDLLVIGTSDGKIYALSLAENPVLDQEL